MHRGDVANFINIGPQIRTVRDEVCFHPAKYSMTFTKFIFTKFMTFEWNYAEI